MLINPASPFPVVDENFTYHQAQAHSAEVDSWLGLEIEKIELELNEKGCRKRAPNAEGDKQELWIGLATKSLLTPYTEIRFLLNQLNPQEGSTVVDLGAAYGRMGFVIGRHFPKVKFVGYEFVGERVKEGQRCLDKFKYPFIELKHADLSAPDFSPTAAEYYFIYDFGNPKVIEKTLHDLRRIAQKKSITVIGRGRSSRDLIERHHPWLSDVVKPLHLGHSSIYRSSDT
jgi:precorrin-6B methylase 2